MKNFIRIFVPFFLIGALTGVVMKEFGFNQTQITLVSVLTSVIYIIILYFIKRISK